MPFERALISRFHKRAVVFFVSKFEVTHVVSLLANERDYVMRKFPRMRERSKKDRSRWGFEYIKNDSAERVEDEE